MANMAELIAPILDAAEVKSVAEVGAYAGDFTVVLLDWAEEAGLASSLSIRCRNRN